MADGNLVDGIAVAGAGLVADEQAVVEELAGGIGSRTQSRVPTPTILLMVMVVLGS